ncbi:MAG: hypothetical protein LBF86_08860 [Helicobacteraceae bacterium]|jgi:hypothetical protein|nr:hypothetical protein [Helicobacteraceae bacterium]
MRYIVAVSLLFSFLIAERSIDSFAPSFGGDAHARMIVEKTPMKEDDARRGERLNELGIAESRYTDYIDGVKRREIEYYRKVRDAKEAFYKRMQALN